MEFNIIFFSVLGVMLFCIFLFLRPSKQDKIEEAELQRRLADEFIYNPITGEKMTLEEAESGVYSDPDVFDRIKSDEEIETYYSDEQQELEYIARDLQKLNLTPTDSQEVFDLFEASHMSKAFDSFNLVDCYKVKEGRYLCFVQISNQYLRGGVAFETQMAACLLRSKSSMKSGSFEDLEIEHLHDATLVRLPRIAKHADLNEFMTMIIRG